MKYPFDKDTGNAGKTEARGLKAALSNDTDGFRTSIRNDIASGQEIMLRTKGGFPEITVSEAKKKEVEAERGFVFKRLYDAPGRKGIIAYQENGVIKRIGESLSQKYVVLNTKRLKKSKWYDVYSLDGDKNQCLNAVTIEGTGKLIYYDSGKYVFPQWKNHEVFIFSYSSDVIFSNTKSGSYVKATFVTMLRPDSDFYFGALPDCVTRNKNNELTYYYFRFSDNGLGYYTSWIKLIPDTHIQSNGQYIKTKFGPEDDLMNGRSIESSFFCPVFRSEYSLTYFEHTTKGWNSYLRSYTDKYGNQLLESDVWTLRIIMVVDRHKFIKVDYPFAYKGADAELRIKGTFETYPFYSYPPNFNPTMNDKNDYYFPFVESQYKMTVKDVEIPLVDYYVKQEPVSIYGVGCLALTANLKTVDYLYMDIDEDIYIYFEMTYNLHDPFEGWYTNDETYEYHAFNCPQYARPLTDSQLKYGFVVNVRGVEYRFDATQNNDLDVKHIVPYNALYGIPPFPKHSCPYTNQNDFAGIAYTTKEEESAGSTPQFYLDLCVEIKLWDFKNGAQNIHGIYYNKRYRDAVGEIIVWMPSQFCHFAKLWFGNAPYYENIMPANYMFWNEKLFDTENNYFRLQVCNGVKGPWGSKIGSEFAGDPRITISRI